MAFLNYLSILLPIGSTFLGFEIVLFVGKRKFNGLELFSLSFPIGMLITSIAGLILNLILFCSFLHYLAQIFFTFFSAIAIQVLFNRRSQIFPSTVSKTSLFTIFMFGSIFSILTFLSVFPTKDTILQTGENDMLLEISMIASFAKGVNKKSNLLSGFQINLHHNLTTYSEVIPFFYSSLLRAGRASVRTSILAPATFLTFSICSLIFCIVYRVTKNQYIACLSIPTVFLLSGPGYKSFVNNNDRKNGYTDYVFLMGSLGVSNWGHPMLHNFLTSRVNLMCLALSLCVYLLLEVDLFHVAGILSLLCFLVRPQSGFVLCLAFFIYKIENIVNRLKYYGLPFIISSFLFLRQFEKCAPLWLSDLSSNSLVPFLSFFVNIYGYSMICLLFTFRKATFMRALNGIFLFYFLAYFKLQNDHRFNFFTTQAVVTPLIVIGVCTGMSVFHNLWKNDQLQGISLCLTLFVFVMLNLSASLGIYNRILQRNQVFGEEENDIAKWIVKNTNRKSIFAAPSNLNWNPAITRAGRVGFIGNSQALQDYFINATSDTEKLQTFINRADHKISGVDYFIFMSSANDWKYSLTKSPLLRIAYNNGKFTVMEWKSTN
ncbi:hypothetical protein TRFO_28029 [Tritrichomonas foetus]|uniref:Mannosyltransferase n=1 Tax=Tritrichomonas foetus TaxID=1144522 RepID=A0A1J4JZV6_9EUKA|nr:hypothetical protein TRFO_28029 [Tritrichomonas foetus]|eukprot:OHT04515.1 hypothetical protein TRFO_28029 [Tritrichomonas foetus]